MSSPATAFDFAATIRSLGLASGFLARPELRELEVGCEATKKVLMRRALDLVSEAYGMPVLSSKSCDGTPLNIAHESRRTLGITGTQAVTKGRKGQEFLVSNQFLRTRGLGGDMQTSVLLSEAVPLPDTGASATLMAAQVGWKWLRELGHRGLAIEHFVWDRKGFTKLERETRRWHELQPHPDTCPPFLDMEGHLLTDLIVVTPCSLHDSQNAFKWGMKTQCEDTSLMRDLYVSVESLRNSSDLLSSKVAEWVCLRLSFRESRGQSWKDEQEELWQTLAVSPMTADLLIEELELSWSGGRLWIKEDAQVTHSF